MLQGPPRVSPESSSSIVLNMPLSAALAPDAAGGSAGLRTSLLLPARAMDACAAAAPGLLPLLPTAPPLLLLSLELHPPMLLPLPLLLLLLLFLASSLGPDAACSGSRACSSGRPDTKCRRTHFADAAPGTS